jgi:hypothetical protein
MALCFRLVLSETRRPGSRLFLAAWGQTQYSAGVQLRLSRAAQKRVTFLRELFKIIQVQVVCQAEIETFCDFQPLFDVSVRISRMPETTQFATAQQWQITERPKKGAEHSAPELLKFKCSGLGLDSGLPLLPGLPKLQAATAIKRLDCAPSFP